VKQYTGEPIDGPTTLVIYPGADGVSSLYEDDGHSLAYQRNDWMKIEMAWQDGARRLTVRLAEGSRVRAPEKRTFEVRVAGSEDVRTVTFDGRPVEITVRAGFSRPDKRTIYNPLTTSSTVSMSAGLM